MTRSFMLLLLVATVALSFQPETPRSFAQDTGDDDTTVPDGLEIGDAAIGTTGTHDDIYELHVHGSGMDPFALVWMGLLPKKDQSDNAKRFTVAGMYVRADTAGEYHARIPFPAGQEPASFEEYVVLTKGDGMHTSKTFTVPPTSLIGPVDDLPTEVKVPTSSPYFVTRPTINHWSNGSGGSSGTVAITEAGWYQKDSQYYVMVKGDYGTVGDCLTVTFDHIEETPANPVVSTLCSVNGISQFCAIFHMGTEAPDGVGGVAWVDYPAERVGFTLSPAVTPITTSLDAFLAQGTYCAGFFVQ